MAIAPHSWLIAAIRPGAPCAKVPFGTSSPLAASCNGLASLILTASGRPQVSVGTRSYWIPVFAKLAGSVWSPMRGLVCQWCLDAGWWMGFDAERKT